MTVVSRIEQWLLELINLARLDPENMAEAFAIDLNAGLPPGTISTASKQPLAMSGILLETADFHGAWMLDNNSFGTTGYLGSNPGDRMAYAGFNAGEAFDWSESLGLRNFDARSSIDESGVAYNIWRDLFLDPGVRASMLAPDINEAGLSFLNGLVGDTGRKGYVLTQDMADSDAVFITGAAYVNGNFKMSLTFLPDGRSNVGVSTKSSETTTGDTGGYRLAVEAGKQQVRLGDARVSVTVGDENIKLDLIGDSVLRSSHSVNVISGLRFAELIGVSDATLSAGNNTGTIRLYGNKGDNRISGNNSNNVLDGGEGNDLMQGGAGDDSYMVDSTSDRVIEKAGQGYDQVFTTASFKLAANSEVEMIRITNSIFWDEIDLTGNRFAQELRANYGNNRLDGGGGGDILAGYNGDDLYIIRHSADQIVDWVGGGNDRLKAAVSFTLATDDEIESMETLNPTATAAISLAGNGFDQKIVGNAGRNTLNGMGGEDVLTGGGGNDILIGGAGTDTLLGGAGSDRFVFQAASDSEAGSGRDSILDWEAVDRIDLSTFDANPAMADRQAFSFVGLVAANAALGLGQVGYYHSGNSTFVVANSDADAAIDFEIRLLGIHDLVPNDFVLL